MIREDALYKSPSSVVVSPADLNLPAHFPAWRPGQEDWVLTAAGTDKRFIGMALPVGCGKSISYVGAAALAHAGDDTLRTLVLTGNKGLQDQLVSDFSPTLFDVRGMDNYDCRMLVDPNYKAMVPQFMRSARPTCANGPCIPENGGLSCQHKESGCLYYDRVRAAEARAILSTNYSFWMSRTISQLQIGTFETLVCDEAHSILDWIVSFMRVTIKVSDLLKSASRHSLPLPTSPTLDQWRAFATLVRRRNEEARQMGGQTEMGTVSRQLETLAGANATWHFTAPDLRGDKPLDAGPTDIKRYVEPLIFRGTKRVILSSATITRAFAADCFGIAPEDLEWIEADMPLALARRPIIYMPVARLTYRSDESDWTRVLMAADKIIADRADRKGLVHSVSYQRMQAFRQFTRNGARLISHSQGSQHLNEAVEHFIGGDAGAVLISPAITTGFDFKGEQCRYQIVLKVPFPDSRDPYYVARQKRDLKLGDRTIAQTLVQMYGRALRSSDDWAEFIVLDGNFGWFVKKNANLFPQWFLNAIQTRDAMTAPAPMERPH